MSASTTAILATMLTLAPPSECQSERDRYQLIAGTISVTAENDVEDKYINWAPDELAAMLIATAFSESRFKREVHSGRVKGDPKRGVSTCLMQINGKARTTRRGHKWKDLAGLDAAATARCIETGADHIEVHAQACGRTFGCVMARYQGHKSRHNPKTRKRVATFYRVLGMLRGGERPRPESGAGAGLEPTSPSLRRVAAWNMPGPGTCHK